MQAPGFGHEGFQESPEDWNLPHGVFCGGECQESPFGENSCFGIFALAMEMGRSGGGGALRRFIELSKSGRTASGAHEYSVTYVYRKSIYLEVILPAEKTILSGTF